MDGSIIVSPLTVKRKITEYLVLGQWFYSPSDACIVVVLMTSKNRDFYSTPFLENEKQPKGNDQVFLPTYISPVLLFSSQSLFPYNFCDTPIPPQLLVREPRRVVVQSSGLGKRLVWVWFLGESLKGASASLLNLSESWFHQLSSGDEKISTMESLF